MLVEAFVAKAPVEALDERVLSGLARLDEVEAHGLSRECEDFPPLFGREARSLRTQRVRAGLKLDESITPFVISHRRTFGAGVTT